MKRRTKSPFFTSDQAAQALNVLIADGKIAARDVADALERREQLIRDLRRRLVALELGPGSGVETTGSSVVRSVTSKPKREISAARRAALRLHGQYLGHIRALPKKAKAKIRGIREAKGVPAAIEAARRLSRPVAREATSQRDSLPARQPYDQGPAQRKLAAYRQRERPKPDRHGGSGAGRQQGGSGAGRERG